MNIKNNPSLQQKLASEYVLGTLRGGARRRFTTWLKQDPHLQQVVREWHENLMPMVEFSSSAQPEIRVWHALEKRLNLIKKEHSGFFNYLQESLNFWRNIGIASTVAALLMVTILINQQIEQSIPVTTYVATLSDDQSQAIAIISGDTKSGKLNLRFVNMPTVPEDKSLELWAVAKNGSVKSLGLVDGNNSITLEMPSSMTPESTPVLAISLEPKGGSGNPEKPSGPIIFKGNWLKLS
jgi:anti-sigma-K factor RskA